MGIRSAARNLPKTLQMLTLWEIIDQLTIELQTTVTPTVVATLVQESLLKQGVPAPVFQNFITKLNSTVQGQSATQQVSR
mmetsp:Transcript_5795/g.8896  ORF Transcript_5795/g.8896 Transcript_5795/m.8896 type:complete len:80 (-) Transcript_5795:5654-5893(-)